MRKTEAAATIEDVAQCANVSVATVSRVINKSSLVSEKTTQRVIETIEALGYVPNVSARNLRKRESRVVLVLAPNFANPYYSHILPGICDSARMLGYSAFICSGQTESQEQTLLEMLETKRADGAILFTCNYDDDWLANYSDKFPLVQTSEAVDGINIPYVAIDNYRAMRDSMEHVHSLGHEKIGFITIRNKFLSTRLRKAGYRDAVEEYYGHDAVDESLIFEMDDYGFESGRKAAIQLLSRNDRPSAIVCASDVLALGVIAAARELNLRVPEDISVVGFDDVDYTKMFHPYLTTIRQPCYQLGWESMKVLQRCIERGTNLADRIVLPHELKKRESTAVNREKMMKSF